MSEFYPDNQTRLVSRSTLRARTRRRIERFQWRQELTRSRRDLRASNPRVLVSNLGNTRDSGAAISFSVVSYDRSLEQVT